MKKRRWALAPVELLLMKAAWRLGKATVHEIRDAVAGERELAYTTVLTMLRTLEQKGFLTHEEVDRKYVYRPLVSEEHVRAGMLQDLLQRAFDGSRELLLTRLLELRRPDDRELKALKEIIRKSEKSEGSAGE